MQHTHELCSANHDCAHDVGAAPETVVVRSGPIDAFVRGVARTWDVSALTLRMIGRMVVGEASVRNLSGPLTIADFAGRSAQRVGGWRGTAGRARRRMHVSLLPLARCRPPAIPSQPPRANHF